MFNGANISTDLKRSSRQGASVSMNPIFGIYSIKSPLELFLKSTLTSGDNDKIKTVMDRLKSLTDAEERQAVADIFSNTRQTTKTAVRTEQKMDDLTKTIEGMSLVQQSRSLSTSFMRNGS